MSYRTSPIRNPRQMKRKRKRVTFRKPLVDSDIEHSQTSPEKQSRDDKIIVTSESLSTEPHENADSHPPTKRTRLQTNTIKRARYNF